MGVFTVGIVFLGSVLVASAAPPRPLEGKTYCMCNCATSIGVRDLGWEKVGACSSANGRKCSTKQDGKTYSGTLNSCWQCTGTGDGVCTRSGPGAAAAPPATEVSPGISTEGTTLPAGQKGVIPRNFGRTSPTGKQ